MVAQGGKTPAALYRDDPVFEALLRHGYLKDAGVVASVICDDCDEMHAAPVVFEGGRYGFVCPDIGFVPQDRADLQAVQPDLPLLIDRLADAFDCKRRKAGALYGQTWRIGAVAHDAGEVMLYFHPRLQGEGDAHDLDHAMSREVRSQWRLIVTALGTLPFASAETVRLGDLVEIDTETGALRIVVEPSNLAGMPRKNAGGWPSEYGALMSALIAARNQSGTTLSGRNAEAKALLADFKQEHPNRTAPSLSTVKEHVSKTRGGR